MLAIIAAIWTESLGAFVTVPDWQPTTNIAPEYIAYSQSDMGEYLRPSRTGAAAVNSIIDGYYERYIVGKSYGSYYLGDTEAYSQPLANWKTLAQGGEALGIRDDWDGGGARVITNSFRLISWNDIINTRSAIASGYHGGLLADFGGDHLEAVAPDAVVTPPITWSDQGWQDTIPIGANTDPQAIYDWASVRPKYSYLLSDGDIWRHPVKQSFGRSHVVNWLEACYSYCPASLAGNIGEVFRIIEEKPFGYRLTPARDGYSMRDVVKNDLALGDVASLEMCGHWTNDTLRLDWKRQGLINNIERDMQRTYALDSEDQYYPIIIDSATVGYTRFFNAPSNTFHWTRGQGWTSNTSNLMARVEFTGQTSYTTNRTQRTQFNRAWQTARGKVGNVGYEVDGNTSARSIMFDDTVASEFISSALNGKIDASGTACISFDCYAGGDRVNKPCIELIANNVTIGSEYADLSYFTRKYDLSADFTAGIENGIFIVRKGGDAMRCGTVTTADISPEVVPKASLWSYVDKVGIDQLRGLFAVPWCSAINGDPTLIEYDSLPGDIKPLAFCKFALSFPLKETFTSASAVLAARCASANDYTDKVRQLFRLSTGRNPEAPEWCEMNAAELSTTNSVSLAIAQRVIAFGEECGYQRSFSGQIYADVYMTGGHVDGVANVRFEIYDDKFYVPFEIGSISFQVSGSGSRTAAPFSDPAKNAFEIDGGMFNLHRTDWKWKNLVDKPQ